jgi:two-component system, sensor histidine kinase PdtaS
MARSVLPVMLFIALSASGQVKPVIDSLRNKADTTRSQETRINLLQQIAYEWAEANFDSGFYYASKMKREANALSDLKLVAKSHIALGIVYDYHGQLDSARSYYKSAYLIASDARDTALMATADFDLATIEYAEGNYLQAIDVYKRTGDLFQKLGNERYLAKVYNNTGQVYMRTENYKAAIAIYQESIAIKTKLNDTKGILNTMTNLSSAYFENGDFVNAEKTSKDLMDLARSVSDTMAYKNELLNLARIYKTREQPDVALPVLKEALSLMRPTDPATMHAALYGYWADYSLARNNLIEAKNYLAKLEPLHQSTQVLKVLYYRLMADYYKKTNNMSLAYDFLNKLMEENNRQLNEKVRKRAKELEVIWETEKKENQILSLELEKQSALAQTQQSKFQRNLFIVSSVAFLLLAGLGFYLFRTRAQRAQALADKNEIVTKSLQERETLLREIHHRVKNNLQIISSLLNLQVQNVKDEAALSAVSESRNRVKSMAMIHEQLYRHHGVTGIFLPDYIKQLAESLRHAFGRDDETIPFQLSIEPFLVDVDTAIPLGLIINELLTNSFKHAFPENREGLITITLQKQTGVLQLCVADNGVGISSAENGSTSFGYSLVNMLVQKLGGNISVGNGQGTQTNVVIKEFTVVESPEIEKTKT